MFKKLLLIGVALLLLSAAACDGGTPTTTPTPANRDRDKEPISVAVFVQNALDGKYDMEERVTVSGTVKEVSTIYVGVTIVYLTPGDEKLSRLYVMEADFNEGDNPHGLSPGQKIVVEGNFWGIIPADLGQGHYRVTLGDCELIKVLQ